MEHVIGQQVTIASCDTFWTVIGSIAAVIGAIAAGLAACGVFYAANQLKLSAWVKAQEIFTDDNFVAARGRIFRRFLVRGAILPQIRVPRPRIRKKDYKAAMLVCRKMDELCRLWPLRRRIISTWGDPLGKSWILLAGLVHRERIRCGNLTKWNAFARLGECAARGMR